MFFSESIEKKVLENIGDAFLNIDFFFPRYVVEHIPVKDTLTGGPLHPLIHRGVEGHQP